MLCSPVGGAEALKGDAYHQVACDVHLPTWYVMHLSTGHQANRSAFLFCPELGDSLSLTYFSDICYLALVFVASRLYILHTVHSHERTLGRLPGYRAER